MISNVVGLSSVGVDINHKDLQRVSAPGVHYNPHRFSGTIIRLKVPRCALLVFSNGKVVIAGAKSKGALTTAVHKFVKMLWRIGYNKATVGVIKVTNVVASSALPGCLDINTMSATVRKCYLDKERFPGATIDLASGGKAIAFASGKYFVTGFKEEEQAMQGLKEASDIMIQFVLP